MTREEFKERYCKRMVERGHLSSLDAEEDFEAADDCEIFGDYTCSPEDVADDNLSYMMEDAGVVR